MQAGEEVTDLGTALVSEGLTALPPEIGQLTALTVLDLFNNQLTALPPEIRKLTKLRALYLHGNDALGVLPEVLGKTISETGRNHENAADPRAIMDYYFSRQRGKDVDGDSGGVQLRGVSRIEGAPGIPQRRRAAAGVEAAERGVV